MNIVHLNRVLPREETVKELEILDGRAWTIHFLFFFVFLGDFSDSFVLRPKERRPIANICFGHQREMYGLYDDQRSKFIKLSLLERAKTLRPRTEK